MAEERVRFSRDLHDLLGHSLSLIVVKAEVVRRMASRDPERAVAEATEIETVGRRALDEVREAVTGYRESGLHTELRRARHSLLEAGIEPTIDLSEAPLTAEAGALLGWVVREGVTNVLRHSRARHCRIEVDGRDGHASLRVQDDGVGGTAPPGNGLRGLAERTAAAGGRLVAGPRTGGGFSLCVDLPLGGKSEYR